MAESTKEEILEELAKHFKIQLNDNQELDRIYFSSENILNGRIGLPVTVKYKHTTKGKNSRVIDKKREMFFYPPFDPFTGERV